MRGNYGTRAHWRSIPAVLLLASLVCHLATGSAAHAEVYDVRAYGAKGGAAYVTTGSVVKGSNLLKIGDALYKFSEADVGMYIEVQNAGSQLAGPHSLVATIVSYVSPTEVKLSDAASVTATNLRVLWGADDSAAIEAAIDAALAAGGGEVYFPAGHYISSRNHVIAGTAAARIEGFKVRGTRASWLHLAAVNVLDHLTFDYVDNACVEDMNFVGPNSSLYGVANEVVHFKNTTRNGIMDRLYCTRHRIGFPFDNSSNTRATIRGCVVEACSKGYSQSNSFTGMGIFIGNTFVSETATNLRSPIIGVAGQYTIVADNYLEIPAGSAGIGGTGNTWGRISVTGNTLKGGGPTSTGITVAQASTTGKASVSGNVISNVGVGIVVGANDCSVSGNTIEGTNGPAGTGIALFSSNSFANNVALTGNSLSLLAKGVDGYSQPSDRISIAGNTFAKTVTNALTGNGAWTNSRASANAGLPDF